ncbi:uncharacterized protein Pyn_37335 [Prunus yedoensis var. nudiflora]|uniref:Late embryogenesis abundant protein LEA-2 subgroup domain-containing protein n=1 Tax=Prunus yedoensis var. nudiflora TaxID=2094558 RepID=A0A314YHM3_PRUYE|nr:uncharacterized protein Pyn_37335 [Prunus yedoensis var. nudiflora]
MAAKGQGKPLAPANSYHLRSDEEEVIVSSHIKLSQRKYVMCCGCVSALFLIIAVTAIVLGFTVFHVKGPRIKMNNVTIQRLELANGTLRSDTNLTLLADVSIKNPNVASFKYGTQPLWFTTGRWREIMVVPGFTREVASGTLKVSTYTRIQGKVKILMVNKNVVVELNCSMTYNFASKEIQGTKDCKPRVSL